MDERGIVCIFAKPPRLGAVKTRLAQVVGARRAAELARAFLRDTGSAARQLPWARAVVATTGPLAEAEPELARTAWPQGDGDLGERIERVLRRALRENSFAIAMGADTPGLPRRLFEQAKAALIGTDAVLGPSRDGGFYLLGLRRCPRGLLRDLPWSSPDTFRRTWERLQDSALSVRRIEPWFDVDRIEDLAHLEQLLLQGRVHAPETQRALRESPLSRHALVGHRCAAM